MSKIFKPTSYKWHTANAVAVTAIQLGVIAGAHAAEPITDTTLINTPLEIQSFADPNIMLLIDSSGSMNNVVPDTPYNAATDYVNCPSSMTLGTGSRVDVRIQSDGDVYINYGGTYYDWGKNSGGTGITGRTKKCFDTNASYEARLYGEAGSSGNEKYPSGYLQAQYTGNYLNWYFSNASQAKGDNFGANARVKAGVERRLDIAKTASTTLVDSMSSARVGLSRYGSSRARILEGLDDVDDSSHKTDLKNSISGISGGGSTPLAESFESLGRYFVQGHHSQTITLNPVGQSSSTDTASSVFVTTPEYDSGETVPSSSDPAIQYQCQSNFIVALTDGRPQSDRDIDNVILRDYDGDCQGAGSCKFGYDMKAASQQERDDRYESAGSDYLDDVVLALNDIDLRPDLDDGDTTPNEPEDKQNIITYMIGFADDQVINDPLMIDAGAAGGATGGGTVNGVTTPGFYTAANASELVNAFNSAVSSISEQVGSVASVAFNSSSLDTGSSVFVAQFNSSKWSGKLYNYALDPATGLFLDNGSTKTSNDISSVNEMWEASSILDAANYNNRKIYTYDGSEGLAFTVANLNASNLSTVMTSDLNAAAAGTAEQVLEFLRGDRSLEGTTFRNRDSRLGDIINSSPVFVGDPVASYPATAPFPEDADNSANKGSYSWWKGQFNVVPPASSANEEREPMIYVGANDGMLHGFNANLKTSDNGGDEVMAYVPNFISSAGSKEGYHYLTEADYNSGHHFYVDATVSVADVHITKPTGGVDAWRTILVGGARGGGRGLYALDISDTDFDANNADDFVLWEFAASTDNSKGDEDLGYSFSRSTIVMTQSGKWAVVVGNGYNSGGDGKAKLYILFIEEGMDGWGDAGDYIEIDTGVGNTTFPNGLSSPRVVDLDGDSVADKVYAGDLYGNLWCFDISATNSGQWDSCYSAGSSPEPMFQTTADSLSGDASKALQPITTTPLVARIAGTTGETVFFGTGQYVVNGDITNTDNQAFYAVNDPGSKNKTPLSVSDLEPRVLTETTVSGFPVRNISGNAVDWAGTSGSQQYGWYIPFITSGERSITRSTIISNILFFNTSIPSSVKCEAGGTGWLMTVDFETGLAPANAVFDANNDGVIDVKDIDYVGAYHANGLPSESKVLGNNRYTSGYSGSAAKSTLDHDKLELEETTREGRLGWEELYQ
ncbi:PilC/PilY family type IV pilus protein [Dasania sp. GY-MA-18]|uniref:PilC/PilY family type IV pilus protein n=1 Tax=Dasania phycosphaerae TaxID=2950436 RepID=A0A9J6RPI5_9GAMM|nr:MULTISPECIES: PilC/PilY family type IV pilus protein [Dasania]MCR8923597.1 PilC/PilY family type IV pilus protein [Dasania sp. GY-MA-18]MCZ0866031.1 PilC/PilY family type IV pilus protein [Dasania phycosphaerae]MCZ0869755.1 PilC/PilY family type IV pilus protein [Dasania phycosphaerae]